MLAHTLTALLALGNLAAVAAAPQDPEPSPAVPALLAEARGALEAGELERARKVLQRALERDPLNLDGLALSSEVARAAEDLDRAVHDLHIWVETHDGRPRTYQDRKQRTALGKTLEELDPEAESWSKLQTRYVRGLASLAKEYQRRKDLLGALDVWAHVMQVDPTYAAAPKAIAEIRRTGGAEVAIEDIFAGAGDPTEGLSDAELKEVDARHAEWDKAWTKETDNYRYKTDAGKLVLETSSIAMEQMNRFYRRFFRFMEDGGKTPQIEIRIFKNRDEYLELGSNPVEWSGGQFTGSAVETYVGGVSGNDGIRSMYQTLFHEAAHQFVSLTGPFVPGWLNEAHASFFEGCTILSNGSVRWNQVPPGRLFPLAQRMEGGWMTSAGEVAAGGDGEFPEPTRAPPFAMVVRGDYAWGPPWYAPTWGVVYFLYNYRDDEGRTVWRDALHEYYTSFKRGRPEDPILHFEETVLTAKLSPVKTLAELDPIWKAWILELRDRMTGKSDGGSQLLKWADAALERGEQELALEFLLEARDSLGADPDLLWKTAELLQDLGEKSRAAATYREFRRELELRGLSGEDPRHDESLKRIERLDPLVVRYRNLKKELADDGLALAKGYEGRELVTMALEIARRMSASFSIPAALDYYIELAERTGKSLARWRVAYDERSLDGWSGNADSYQAYGATIRADVPPDPSDPKKVLTQMLICDVPFDADYSLESELQIPLADGGEPAGNLAGLCFGRKGDQDHHAVLLFPQGYLDIATNRGGTWQIRDHRSVPFSHGAWHKLRIDVTGKSLDVYLDDLYVRSLEFRSADVIRGGFGLATGPGRALYRNIRILARDPHDPAARIERQLAMKKVLADASLRQEGAFAGFEPPELAVEWQRGEPTTLAALRGRPVLLAFWTPAAEKVIPCAAYLENLIERGADAELQTIVVCDAGTSPAQLQAALAGHPLEGARLAIDERRGTTYDRFYVKPGFHGLPRFLLIDRAGRVRFEGDPGLTAGEGWSPEAGPTYVDEPFDELVGRGR